MLENLIGQTLDDKYRIEYELGKGGMGSVYFATHAGTERPVAVKVIAPEFMKNQEFVERFRREARAAGRMRHPNIVDVTDFGFAPVGAERVAYLVMEYLDGCTLAEILAEEKVLPVNWVIDIFEQACSAVDDAHVKGIVHRDLKPDNIWLEPNRRGGYTVKVLDFGIAKVREGDPSKESVRNPDSFSRPQGALTNYGSVNSTAAHQETSLECATIIQSGQVAGVAAPRSEEAGTLILAKTESAETEEAGTLIFDHNTKSETAALPDRSTADAATMTTSSLSNLTRVGSLLGTPLYMSPEQCRGDASDSRSDIYSLGVIAYQMLTGTTPFNGDLKSVMRGHMTEEPPRIKRKGVPGKLAKVVHSALSKDPADRPPTAAGFANELRAYSEGGFQLIRRAATLFAEHISTFLQVSLFLYIPVIIIQALTLGNNYATAQHYFPKWLSILLAVFFGLDSMLIQFFMATVQIGVVTRLVTQLLAAPLRPIKLRPAFEAFKKRARYLVPTTMLFNIATLVGIVCGIIPGVIILLRYALVTAVLMMEDFRGKAAFRRANELSRRSRRTVALILAFQFCMPLLFSAVVGFLVVTVLKAYSNSGVHASLFGISFQVLMVPATIVIGAFSAVLNALLYLKMRQAGGETFKDALDMFNYEEMPKTRWQQRMRERTRMPTRISRA